MQAQNLQGFAAAVGFAIHAPDHAVTKHNRQTKIAKHPLRRRHITLNAKIHPKQSAQALAVYQHIVKRLQDFDCPAARSIVH